VQFKPLTDEAYLPLPPLAPNNRKRQREGEDERKDEGEDDEDRLVKRQKRLIKNRESAQLSRIRKKQHVDELERTVSGLQEASTQLEWRLEELQLENTVLRDDNSYLRELISTQPSYVEHMRARDSARQLEYQQQRARLQEQQRARAASTTAHRQQQAASIKAANVCLLIIIFAFGLFINSPDATSTILGPKNIVFVRDNSARSLTGLEAAQSFSTPQFDASYGHDDRGDEEHNTSTALFCPAARRVLVNTGRGSEVATSALSFVMKLDEFKRGEDEIMVTRATDPSQPYVHVQCSAYTLSSVSMVDLDGESRDTVKTVSVDTRPREHVAQAA
jgi:regulator of replication initiation timing